MKEGFKSFQQIEKGELLANLNGEELKSKKKGFIFMPLYQKRGSEGFFTIQFNTIILFKALCNFETY